MILYNYVAGAVFPPSLPPGLSTEWRKGIHVVFFVLEGAGTNAGGEMAGPLLDGRPLRGLVYSYAPENRDYGRCADFFRVAAFPSYVAVAWKDAAAFLGNEATSKTAATVRALVINGDALSRTDMHHTSERTFECVRRFITNEAMPEDARYAVVRDISTAALARAAAQTTSLPHVSEITLFFTRPAWRHTKFERAVYDTFVEFGAATDDVLVRVLYPSHISDAYHTFIKKSGAVKLPAAVFSSTGNRRVTVRLERDILQRALRAQDQLRYLISDLHRAIGLGQATEAQELLRQIEDDTGLNIELHSAEGAVDNRVIHVHTLVGDIVMRDKIQQGSP